MSMSMSIGKVVDGIVVVEGARLPEGAMVTVFADDDPRQVVQLSPALQAELEAALDEADREEGVPAEVLLESLRTHG